MTTESVYASEQGHWYTRDGKPAYEQPNKSKPGEFRRTTVRDARKLDLLPSVTTILKIQGQPGLDHWKKEQVAKAAFNVPCMESEDEWVEYVLQKAEDNMSVARDTGSEVHGAIERFLSIPENTLYNIGFPEAYMEHVKAAVDALKEFRVWGQPFKAEKSFANPLGYGGKIDLFGDGWVVDFKCVDRLDKKLDYMDRCAQLTAYAQGKLNTKLYNIFISTGEPGKYLIREWDDEEKKRGWEIFKCSLNLWCAVNNYYP